jgi:23S rRNA (adenine2503-C2)-methyltransferase
MRLADLDAVLTERGEKPYRRAQALEAVFRQLVSSWDEATVLPPDLRAALNERAPIVTMETVTEAESGRGDTRKAAFKLPDGNLIEAVLMRHDGTRRTVCVSSQAGCPMRCSFCATGTMGLKRNLTEGEIVDQVLHFSRLLAKTGEKVSNVVLMGMGEPMHNYDNVMAALRTMNDPKGLAIGARHLSISTCGIVPGILRLADEPLQVNLAISLHAPTDELRTSIMPVNNAYPIAKLLAAVDTYIEKTNRKVMFEYLLIEGVNDTPEVAVKLAPLMAKPLYHVNLIKYHDTGAFKSSPRENRTTFMDLLMKRGVMVTHRISFGEDIDAACGQLANKVQKK